MQKQTLFACSLLLLPLCRTAHAGTYQPTAALTPPSEETSTITSEVTTRDTKNLAGPDKATEAQRFCFRWMPTNQDAIADPPPAARMT